MILSQFCENRFLAILTIQTKSSRYFNKSLKLTWALPLAGEGVRSTLLQGPRKKREHQKSTGNHQESNFSKIKQICMETSWDVEKIQGWYLTPRGSSNLISRTWFPQEILIKSARGSAVSSRIQNLGWTQLKSTSRIIIMNVRFFIWIRFDNRRLGEKGSLPLLLEDHLIFNYVPWRRVFRTIYVEHHVNRCRELFIWIQFDFWNLGQNGVSPPVAWEPPDFWILCPGGECFAPQQCR